MVKITATHVNYYHICHRKLWLFSYGIQMEHQSDAVKEGKLIGETSYPQRNEKYTELELEGIKIDFYDAKNKVVHEIKKSARMENAHRAQVKYYLWVLKQHGIVGATGILEYPKQRQTETVELTPEDEANILKWLAQIGQIIDEPVAPKVIDKPICKQCAYFEYCYV